MHSLSAADLDRIESLARAAQADIHGDAADEALPAALDYATVLALVEAARRGMEA